MPITTSEFILDIGLKSALYLYFFILMLFSQKKKRVELDGKIAFLI